MFRLITCLLFLIVTSVSFAADVNAASFATVDSTPTANPFYAIDSTPDVKAFFVVYEQPAQQISEFNPHEQNQHVNPSPAPQPTPLVTPQPSPPAPYKPNQVPSQAPKGGVVYTSCTTAPVAVSYGSGGWRPFSNMRARRQARGGLFGGWFRGRRAGGC